MANPIATFFRWVGTKIAEAWAAAETLERINMVLSVVTLAVGVKGFMQARQMLAKGQDILANKTSAGGKIPVIYGTRRVGAQVVYMDVSNNDSRHLFVVYALSVGEVDEILGKTIQLDGNPLTDSARFRYGSYIGSDKISSGSGSLNTVSQVGSTVSAGAGGFGTSPTSRYRITFNLHHGAATQTADPMLVASMPNWTSAHKLNGIAYIAAHYKYDKEGMFAGVPQLTVQVRGKKVYDPRDSGQTFGTVSTYEYSSNPALCFLDFITNNEYGKGLTESQINMSTFSSAANVCDTEVDNPFFGGTSKSLTWSGVAGDSFITIGGSDPNGDWWQNKIGELINIYDNNGDGVITGKEITDIQRDEFFDQNPLYRVYFNDTLGTNYSSQTTGSSLVKIKRFHCNGYLDTNKNVMENAKELLANMRGIFLYIDGKYELQIEDTGSSSFTITDDHIIADAGISVDYGNKDKKANKVIVEFFNANKRYELDTATVLHDATPNYYSDDNDEILEIKAEFPYVTDPYIAYNMAKAILVRSRKQMTIQFLGTPEMYKLNVGDIVTLNYAGTFDTSQTCRVEALELQPNGLVAVSLIEYFDVYTWETPPEEPLEELANLPSAYAVKAPTGLTFTDSSSSSTGRPILSWDAPTDYPDYEFRVNVVDSSGNQLMNRIVNTTFAELNFTPTGSNYVASVTSLNTLGTESDAETETFSVSDAPVGLGDIRADSVTANTIDVNQLSAISADMGSITAGSIDIGSGAFSVTSAGVLDATGATIGGSFSSGSGNSIFKADTNGIYLGNATFANAPFKVLSSGEVQTTKSFTAGVAGTDAIAKMDGSGDYRFWSGNETPSNASFSVDKDGKVIAKNLVLKLTDGTVYFDSDTGFSSSAISQISANTGTKVSTVSSTFDADTEYEEITVTSTTSVNVTVSIDTNFGGTYGNATENTAIDEAEQKVPENFTLTIEHSSDGGSTYSTVVTDTFTRVNDRQNPKTTPLSDEYKINTTVQELFISGGGGVIYLATTTTSLNLGSVDSDGRTTLSYTGLSLTGTTSGTTHRIRASVSTTDTNYDTTNNNVSSTTPRVLSVTDPSGNGFYVDNGSGSTVPPEGDITAVQITTASSSGLTGGANFTSGDATFTLALASSIDGAKTFTNNVVIQGNLDVQGTTTTIDTTNLDVKDKNITLNYGTGDTSANANGAGITIQDAVSAGNDATLTWNTSNDTFNFSHDITTTGIQMGTGASNDIQADGKTAYIGSAIFGNSASTNVPATAVHIKSSGTPALRIEDLDSTNQVYDFISNYGVGLSIVDQTSSITPLAFAHTTGNATFAGTISSGNITSSGTGTFDTQVLLPPQGTATSTTTAYESATLAIQGSGWDTNNALARTGTWTIKNVPTSSVYPDFDLNFYEEGNELRFQLHGRGTGGYVDPSAATFHGNVNINADSSGSTGAGAGNLTVAGALTAGTIEGYTFPSYPSQSGGVLTSDVSGNMAWSFNTVSSYVDSGDDRVVTSTGSTGIQGEANLTYNETDGLKITDSLPKLSLIPTSSSATEIILDSTVQGFINFKDGATTDASIGYEGVFNNKLSISCSNGITFGSSNLTTTGTISSGAITVDPSGSYGDGITINAGDNSSATNSNKQIIMSFGGTGNIDYPHSIRTRHNAGADTGNTVEFYLWDYGTDSSSTIGTKRALVLENSTGLDLLTGGYKVGGTTVIDSSRNIINANTVGIGTASVSPGYLLHLKSTGDAAILLEADTDNVTETDNPRIQFSQDGGLVQGRIGYTGGANTFEVINQYNDSLILGQNNLARLTLTATDGLFDVNVNTTSGHGYQVASTTVIDSSRNLTNIGTISSGDIASSGTVPTLTLSDTQSKTWASGDDIGRISFVSQDPSGIGSHETGFILNESMSGGSSLSGALVFGTAGYNATATEALRLDNYQNATFAGTISSGAITLSNDSSDMGFGTAKAGSSVGHTASVDEGIFWHTSNDYGIFRPAGTWSSPNYQQLRLNWATGIELDGGGTNYGKSGINFLNGNIKMDGTQILDASRNLTNIGTISSGDVTTTGINIGSNTGDPFNAQAYIKIQQAGNAYIQMKAGTSAAGGVLIGDTDDDFVGGFIYNNSINTLNLYSNNANALTLDSSQNATFAGRVTTGEDLRMTGNAYLRSDDTFAFLTIAGSAQFGKFKGVSAQTSYANGASTGMFNALNGYAVGTGVGTTVIDSSRNLTNIGTINSSNIVVTTSSVGGVGLEIRRSSSTGRAQLTIADESGGDLWRIGATGPGSTDFAFFDGGANVLTLESSTNKATFAGTIDSGNIYADYSLLGRGFRSANRGELHLNATGATDVAEIFFGYGDGYTDANIRWGISDRGSADDRLIIYRGPYHTGFTEVAWFDASERMVSSYNGYSVNGTTVIDSSRNLTNIASITTSGSIDLTGLNDTTDGADIHLPRGSHITFYGNNANNHSIGSRSNTGAITDDLRISSYGAIYFDLDSNSNNSSAADFVIGRHGGGTGTISNLFSVSGETGAVISNNNITAYGSASDIRLKENIEVIQNPIDKVQKLRGVTFNYKKDGSKSTGLIAQELEEVLPEVVYETHDLHDEKDKFKAVRYGNIVGLLVEAIKEQQQQIDELKQRLDNDS